MVLLLFSSENPESFEEARGGGLVARCGELCFVADVDVLPPAGDALWEFALWFESDRCSFMDLAEEDLGGCSSDRWWL